MSMMKELGIDRLSVDERVLLDEEIRDRLAAQADAAPLTDEKRPHLNQSLAICCGDA